MRKTDHENVGYLPKNPIVLFFLFLLTSPSNLPSLGASKKSSKHHPKRSPSPTGWDQLHESKQDKQCKFLRQRSSTLG